MTLNGDRRLRRLTAAAAVPLAVAGGWLVATATGTSGLERHPGYLYLTSALLAVGLYASTYGIDLGELRGDRRRVLLAVTVGVLLKAALIGTVLYLVLGQPVAFLYGVAVAQIDPLAVAAVTGNQRLSARARALLGSWASFDDPVTVLLSVYAGTFAAAVLGLAAPAGTGDAADLVAAAPAGWGALAGYAATGAANLLFALVAVVGWRLLRRWRPAAWVLLAGLAAVAVWQFLALGVALAGLVVRPPGIDKLLRRITRWAFLTAAGLLGALLAGELDRTAVVSGAVLGVAAFAAQVVVGWALTSGLPTLDRTHLALAQQNGITAIILALRIETQHLGAVAVVGPAIVVVNLLHYAANRLLDTRSTSRPGSGHGTGSDHGIVAPGQGTLAPE